MTNKNKLTNVKGTYQRNINISIPEDSFALISYYSMINNENIEVTLSYLLEYTIRMLRNRLKYHAHTDDFKKILSIIIDDAGINMKSLKENKTLFNELLSYTKDQCEKRYEFSPFEKTYWYEVLIKIIKISKKLNLSDDLVNVKIN